MKRLVFACSVLALFGCATLNDKVKEISKNDSKDRVRKALGRPEAIVQVDKDPEVWTWFYSEGYYECIVDFRRDVVVGRKCRIDQDQYAQQEEADQQFRDALQRSVNDIARGTGYEPPK